MSCGVDDVDDVSGDGDDGKLVGNQTPQHGLDVLERFRPVYNRGGMAGDIGSNVLRGHIPFPEQIFLHLTRTIYPAHRRSGHILQVNGACSSGEENCRDLAHVCHRCTI